MARSSEPDIQSVTIPDLSSQGASKFRRLKDLMWVREAKEDLTAAEFAISIDAPGKKQNKRAIDYDNLLNQLDRRIRDLVCGDESNCNVVQGETPTLTPGKGSASIVYTETQRNTLLK